MASSNSGKLEVEVDVKSHPDKVWDALKNFIFIYPKALPHDYKSVEVLEGDGIAVGSVRLITYGDGSPIVKVSKEKIEHIDAQNKTFTYNVIDGDLLKYYKSFKAHVTVVPKGDGTLVKWSCDYEKDSDEIPIPNEVKDFAVKNFIELDEYIRKESN
ncbi:hypothetical protein UlMin_040347 [Ulmus minor]